MKIAVISDLHLGAGGPTDSFGHDDGEFLRFLRFLERNFERVVLLGDVWETLTGALPGSPLVELGAAREAHAEIARRFERPAYAYVHGNHDIVAMARGVPEELSFHADGVRLLFTHGHQNDLVVKHARLRLRRGVPAAAKTRRRARRRQHGRGELHLPALGGGGRAPAQRGRGRHRSHPPGDPRGAR